jgi:hypothetical protein
VCGLLPATWRPIRADIRNRTPNPTSLEAAGAWLRVHLQPGEVVAGSYNAEYVPWLYADQGIPTFFGIGALKGSAQMDTVARDSSYAHLMGMTSKNAPACPQGSVSYRGALVSINRITLGRGASRRHIVSMFSSE